MLKNIIKYFIIAFVLFLAASYVEDLYNSFMGNDISKELYDVEVSNLFTEMDLNIKSAELKIISGEFNIQTNIEKLDYEITDQKLIINDNSSSFFKKKNTAQVIISIPEYVTFDKVKIFTGAGLINIESLSANYLNLELGAGATTINNLNVYSNLELETGAGSFEVKTGLIHNANINLGVGENNITGYFYGDNNIECGIGETNLNLLNSIDDYSIYVEKGIGKILYNGSSVSNASTIGNGENVLKVTGGIGEVKISTR